MLEIMLSVIIIVYISYYLWNRSKKTIPSVGVIPILGGICEFIRVFGPKAHENLMSRYLNLGPIYQFGFFKNKMTFLFKLRDILKLKEVEGLYPRHIDFKHLRFYRKQRALPLGLLLSNDEEWQRQRKHIGKALLSSSVLKDYFTEVDEVAIHATNNLLPFTVTHDDIDMEDIIGKYVLHAMARVIMGYEDVKQETETVKDYTSIIQIARENFKDAKTLLSTPSFLWRFTKAWPRHSERWDIVLKTTGRYINRFMANKSVNEEDDDTNRPCVLAQLLKSEGLSLPEAHINITDLILASIDTTCSSILWCVYELSRSQKIQEKLYQEIKLYLEEKDCLTFASLHDLHYLRAVIRESQRLHPVGFFVSRMIQEETSICGYHINKNSHVAGSMYVIGRDSDLFPEPEAFLPERWLDSNSNLENFINNVPFGLGRRMCIGRKVADLVISSYIFHLVKCYAIKPVSEEPIQPTFRLLMVPGQPVLINIQTR